MMKKLTKQQENLQLSGIVGSETTNKLLKQYIKDSAIEKMQNDNHKDIKRKKQSVTYLKPVK